ncbi:MAG: hypothetical protein ABI400_15345 [Lacisediminihabitans sp.]
MLVLFAVSLFFKAKAIAIELQHLASELARLDQADRTFDAQRQQIAILTDRAELRRRREQVRLRALVRKRERMSASIQRAQELVRVDAADKQWFPAHNQATQHNPR